MNAEIENERTIYQEQPMNEVEKSTKKSTQTLAEANMAVQRAVDIYGTTEDIRESGFILRDGRFLDLSEKNNGGESGMRSADHRDIAQCYDDNIDGTEAMMRFMNEGNIRLNPESGGIDISAPPTEQQRSALREYINYFKGEVILDISTETGNCLHSQEYSLKTASSAVINAIDMHLRTPEKAEMQHVEVEQSRKNETLAYATNHLGLTEPKGDFNFAKELLFAATKRVAELEGISVSIEEQTASMTASYYQASTNSIVIEHQTKSIDQTITMLREFANALVNNTYAPDVPVETCVLEAQCLALDLMDYYGLPVNQSERNAVEQIRKGNPNLQPGRVDKAFLHTAERINRQLEIANEKHIEKLQAQQVVQEPTRQPKPKVQENFLQGL